MTKTKLLNDFEIFRDQCIELQNLVNCFDSLYGSTDETNLLDHTAQIFFTDLNRWLIDLYYIYSARLLDPAKTKEDSNLTVKYILIACEEAQLSTDAIRSFAEALSSYRASVQGARSKLVAHLDQQTMQSSILLGSHTERDFRTFLKNIQHYCDAVGEAVGAGPMDFSFQPGKGDVLDLLTAIRPKNE